MLLPLIFVNKVEVFERKLALTNLTSFVCVCARARLEFPGSSIVGPRMFLCILLLDFPFST